MNVDTPSVEFQNEWSYTSPLSYAFIPCNFKLSATIRVQTPTDESDDS